MARVGKLTIYVDQGMNSQTLSVRTTGKVGSISLNTVSTDQSYPYKTSSATAKDFWLGVIALAQAEITALP